MSLDIINLLELKLKIFYQFLLWLSLLGDTKHIGWLLKVFESCLWGVRIDNTSVDLKFILVIEFEFWWVVIITTRLTTQMSLYDVFLHSHNTTCVSESWSDYFISLIVEIPDNLIHLLWCMSLWFSHFWRGSTHIWFFTMFLSFICLARLIRSMLVVLFLDFLHQSNWLIWNGTWLWLGV